MTVDELDAAKRPEDLFGSVAPTQDDLRTRYRNWAKIAHPDAGGSNDLMAKLNDIYRQAQRALVAGRWGRTTNVGLTFARGDIANLYLTPEGHLLKMPRSPGRSNLILNEAKNLKKLRAEVEPQYHPYFPELIRSYRHKDPKTLVLRQVNVIEYFEGFYTLAQLKDLFPEGIGGRDMAWMWRRVLVGLGAAREAGVVHGSLTPEHILIHPTMHGVVLVDWTLAGERGDVRQFKLPKWKDNYPRIKADILTYSGDVYMASKAMEHVLHPTLTPRAIWAFLKGCRVSRLPHPWKLKEEFDQLLEELYGRRRYRPLIIPAAV